MATHRAAAGTSMPITAAATTAPPSSRAGTVSLQALVQALGGEYRPIPLPWLYRPAQAVVALVMVLLPLLYLGLIGALIALIVWHARHDLWILNPQELGLRAGRAWLVAALIYVGPIIGGVIAALFMIKPFFAPRHSENVPLSLRVEEQPVVFKYVTALCDALGARRPVQIDVEPRANAAAGFHRGFRSFFSGELRLVIGLTLAADISLRELTGVLAHEFGHFAQGGGMRLGLIIGSVNRWFARVVFERDAWDLWLAGAARNGGHWSINALAWFSILMVGVGRLFLRILMYIGFAVSGFLSRQMEHDADRFASRMAGSASFAQMQRQLVLLAASESIAGQVSLAALKRDRQLADDLPGLVREIRKTMPAPLAQELLAKAAKEWTGLFSTHPAMSSRIRMVEREKDPGLVTADVPARILFRDFDKLCRLGTAMHYQRLLGDNYTQVRQVPAAQLAPKFEATKPR
jgi:Zn-dependent protease with chaperone function